MNGCLLAIDVGNTNIVVALFREGVIERRWRFVTDLKLSREAYVGVFSEVPLKEIEKVVIASVVPGVTEELRGYFQDMEGVGPIVIGDAGVDVGIPLKVTYPEQVGADRAANAVAVVRKFGEACVVVDFGTATNFDVVDCSLSYVGGVIAPGIRLSVEALTRAAAKLPEIEVVAPSGVIGKDTVHAMQSGVYYGYVGLIEGTVKRIVDELGYPVKVVATGGLAPLFAKALDMVVEPDLTVEGIAYIGEGRG